MKILDDLEKKTIINKVENYYAKKNMIISTYNYKQVSGMLGFISPDGLMYCLRTVDTDTTILHANLADYILAKTYDELSENSILALCMDYNFAFTVGDDKEISVYYTNELTAEQITAVEAIYSNQQIYYFQENVDELTK